MLNQNDAFSQRKRSVSNALPEACLMHIQMSCLIIKTMNLAVLNALALAPGVSWLEDVLQLEGNRHVAQIQNLC